MNLADEIIKKVDDHVVTNGSEGKLVADIMHLIQNWKSYQTAHGIEVQVKPVLNFDRFFRNW